MSKKRLAHGRLKLRPYEPGRDMKRTAAQRTATDRNFRIFRLRGLYHQAGLLTGQRRERMQRLVDEELAALGADRMAEHNAAVIAQLEIEETDIPF